MKKPTIAVMGMGFVGLALAVFLAQKRCNVIGIDLDNKKLDTLKKGIAPFYEPGLDEAIRNTKSIKFVNSLGEIYRADFVFVTVGTPSKKDGSIDLQYIKSAASDISKWLKKQKNFSVIVLKSTIVPGTALNIVKPILAKSKKKPEKDFGLTVNPEFLKEGSALYDTINPHVIVIGGDANSTKRLKAFYQKIYPKNIPIKITTPTTAEFIKYANNSFLATKISFINTVANLCQNMPGTSVDEIAEIIGMDPRIGSQFLRAGPGYGGSCFPKDVQAFISFSKNLGLNSSLLKATHQTNIIQSDIVLEMIRRNIRPLKDKTISLLGLAFKENSDDIRESVSIKLIHKLLPLAKIKVHDPQALENTKKIFGSKIKYYENLNDCLEDSECAVILTPWDEYRKLTSTNFKKMRNPLVIDTRRLLVNKKLSIKYIALGIGS